MNHSLQTSNDESLSVTLRDNSTTLCTEVCLVTVHNYKAYLWRWHHCRCYSFTLTSLGLTVGVNNYGLCGVTPHTEGLVTRHHSSQFISRIPTV